MFSAFNSSTQLLIFVKNICLRYSLSIKDMGDEHRQKSSSHPLTEFYVFLGVMIAVSADAPYSCSMHHRSALYLGTLNQTKSGRPCQPWGIDYPQEVDHLILEENFPDGSADAAQNFCRNPLARGHDSVFCYINEDGAGTEECDPCRGGYEGYNGCVLADRGASYVGTIDRTQSFTLCEDWADYPGAEKLKFANGDARQARNYCRNPDPENYEAPWCYIAGVQDKAWEYCDVCKPFQGEVVPGLGFYNWSVENLEYMSKVACIHWCINYGPCMGVSTSIGKPTECKYFIRVDGEAEENELWEHYFVKRVCDAADKETKVHFVAIRYVKTPDLQSSGLARKQWGTESVDNTDECDDSCATDQSCAYYQVGLFSVCFVADSISAYDIFPSKSIKTYIRMPIRCDPAEVVVEYVAVAPEFHDEADVLKEEAVTGTDEAGGSHEGGKGGGGGREGGGGGENDEEKDVFAITEESPHAKGNKVVTIPEGNEKAGLSIPVIAGIAVGVIIVVVGGGFACYKVYKKTKAQDKARAKAEGKLKGTPTAQGEKTKLNP